MFLYPSGTLQTTHSTSWPKNQILASSFVGTATAAGRSTHHSSHHCRFVTQHSGGTALFRRFFSRSFLRPVLDCPPPALCPFRIDISEANSSHTHCTRPVLAFSTSARRPKLGKLATIWAVLPTDKISSVQSRLSFFFSPSSTHDSTGSPSPYVSSNGAGVRDRHQREPNRATRRFTSLPCDHGNAFAPYHFKSWLNTPHEMLAILHRSRKRSNPWPT